MSLARAGEPPRALRPGGRAVIHRILFPVLGLLLLTTAALKALGGPGGALGRDLVLFTPRVQFAAAEAEALLGLWLLSGWARRAAWFVAVNFFLLLAVISGY